MIGLLHMHYATRLIVLFYSCFGLDSNCQGMILEYSTVHGFDVFCANDEPIIINSQFVKLCRVLQRFLPRDDATTIEPLVPST